MIPTKTPTIPNLNRRCFELTISSYEAHALLRLLATACDAERTSSDDRNAATWLAERIGKKLDPAYFGISVTEPAPEVKP